MSVAIFLLLGLSHSVLTSPKEECRETGERHFLSDHEQCDRWAGGDTSLEYLFAKGWKLCVQLSL